jgi:hypothetical protein
LLWQKPSLIAYSNHDPDRDYVGGEGLVIPSEGNLQHSETECGEEDSLAESLLSDFENVAR